MTLDLWKRNAPMGGVRRPALRGRRRQLALEPLEDRSLLTLGFTSAFGLTATLPDSDRCALDAAGDIYVTGDFTGTANFDPSLASTGILKARNGVADAFV